MLSAKFVTKKPSITQKPPEYFFSSRLPLTKSGNSFARFHGITPHPLTLSPSDGARDIRFTRRVLFQLPTLVGQLRLKPLILFHYFSFRSRISPAVAGLAFPLLSFITCPFKKLSAAVLPARKSATLCGFAAMTWSQ